MEEFTFEDCKVVLGWTAWHCSFRDELVENDLEVVIFHLEWLACDGGNRSLVHFSDNYILIKVK